MPDFPLSFYQVIDKVYVTKEENSLVNNYLQLLLSSMLKGLRIDFEPVLSWSLCTKPQPKNSSGRMWMHSKSSFPLKQP